MTDTVVAMDHLLEAARCVRNWEKSGYAGDGRDAIRHLLAHLNSTQPPPPAPKAEGLAAIASAACPICGRETPHAHFADDIERWCAGQVARWGFDARVFPLGGALPHADRCGCCSSRLLLSRNTYQWCRNCGAIRVGPAAEWVLHDGDPERTSNAQAMAELATAAPKAEGGEAGETDDEWADLRARLLAMPREGLASLIESLPDLLELPIVPVHWESNHEAGDGQTVCNLCGWDADESHTLAQCRKNLGDDGGLIAELAERDRRIAELEQSLSDLARYENFELTYMGGHSEPAALESFRQGMHTVCSAAKGKVRALAIPVELRPGGKGE